MSTLTVRRLLLAMLLSVQCLVLSSCLGYRDLDHIVFVTSILIDTDEEKNCVFYFETLNSIRSSSKEANQEERIIYKIATQNPGEAMNRLETFTSAPVTLAHNKVILFTERFARSGLNQAFELFDRWQESSARTLLGIYVGTTDSFIKPNHDEEIMTGLYLYDMLGSKSSVTSYGVKLNIKEFMNQRLTGDYVNSMSVMNVSKDEDTKGQYYLDGLALVKDYTMVGRLDSRKSIYFNFLLNNKVSGNIAIQNPEDQTKMVNLLLQSNRYRSKVSYEDGAARLDIHLSLNTEVSAIQGKLELTDENIAELEASLAAKIRQNCLKLFQEWKDKGIDVFDISEKFERKYPQLAGQNIIRSTELNLEVQVDINGTTTLRDAE
ncbi:Ger(x)C family spore germination protein [Paenibacillus sp. FSL K6-1096]|uniref:Ger(x)C family spore germination protein n=1 Tax=Paenibacillus sp. FSL K6-1096 TaxID=2921460 RepID=UPI0030EE7FDE